MINIEEGKTRREIDIPCQTCGNPTSFRIKFAHNENPNAKTSIHICSTCIEKLQELLAETLKTHLKNRQKEISNIITKKTGSQCQNQT